MVATASLRSSLEPEGVRGGDWTAEDTEPACPVDGMEPRGVPGALWPSLSRDCTYIMSTSAIFLDVGRHLWLTLEAGKDTGS